MNWSIVLGAAIGALGAVAGGMLAGWWQLKREREAREDARSERRRAEWVEDLRAIQDCMDEIYGLIASLVTRHLAHEEVTSEKTQVTRVGNRMFALATRIGDPDLTTDLAFWHTQARRAGSAEVVLARDDTELTRLSRKVNERIGGMLREGWGRSSQAGSAPNT
jgi:hypothetical protein